MRNATPAPRRSIWTTIAWTGPPILLVCVLLYGCGLLIGNRLDPWRWQSAGTRLAFGSQCSITVLINDAPLPGLHPGPIVGGSPVGPARKSGLSYRGTGSHWSGLWNTGSGTVWRNGSDTVHFREIHLFWGYLWFPAIAHSLMWVALRAHASSEQQARLPPRCDTCGYDLRASIDACPECGQPIANRDPGHA